eukprot:Rhum_TRINITY_DN8054_c0_g3::Rhum_TRINITY_DN8054_c0_g3_i1::g.25834::m.25834
MAATVLSAVLVAAGMGAVRTSTWYRVTPKNYTGTITDMNTADISGDVVFTFFAAPFRLYCPENPNFSNCQEVPILNIPYNNVYEGYVVEYDDRYGEYNECNPDPNNGTFECVPSMWGGSCWYSQPNAASWKGICDPAKCACNAFENQAVGQMPCALCDWPLNPMDGPDQCDPFYVIFNNSEVGTAPARVITNASEADCCAACSEAGKVCDGANYYAANATCHLFRTSGAWNRNPTPGVIHYSRTSFNGSATYYLKRFSAIAQKLNGTWFSTEHGGECGPGQSVGEGCYWRNHGVTRTINATCAKENIVRYLRDKYDPSCWEACPQNASLTTSECSIKCMYNTAVRPDVPAHDIASGLTTSFLHKDPALYGCPDWTPDQD